LREINGRFSNNFHDVFISFLLFLRSGRKLVIEALGNWLIVALIIKEVHGEERGMLWSLDDLRFGLWL
jgi:hypothetical protein